MAKWISQTKTSSITPAARKRTAYLLPFAADVIAAIQTYFQDNPDGEEVTLAVLRALGKERLEQIGGGRSFGRVKQDVGLFAAQMLVDLFTAARVQTLRRDDETSVSDRRNKWPDLDWVDSYAPHRVLPPPLRVERILLDTGVVRKVIHGDADALDPAALARAQGGHAVSVADGALAELAAALLRGSVTIEAWSERIRLLDGLLDPDFPVAPGGWELAALWGGHSTVGLDLDEVRAYYRAAWSYLRNVKSVEDLARREVFHAPSGRSYAIRLDLKHVEAVLDEAGRKWSGWVAEIAELLRGQRDGGDPVSEDDLRRLAKSNLLLDMGAADAEKLDLVVHVLAKRATQAIGGLTPYNPKGKPNDPLDLDLLFGIPLPAWICTSDERLHRMVRSTAAADRTAVMTVQELLDKLEDEARTKG
ncbi:MAG: hypothetical protein RBU45_14450 [Myxococcota bacterium]|jgi:hypothetical protein|nr:hypothetical protein [Myxococcota bacterium]